MIKSLKHDFISTGRIMGVIYAIMLGISIFTFVTKDVSEGQLSLIGVLILFFMSICLLVLTTVVVLLDFQKSLYGDRGYLTFTLPVKSWKILASKVLVSGTWFVVALAAIIGSLWVAFTSAKGFFGDDAEMLSEMIEALFGKNVDSMVAMIIARIIILFIEFCFFALVIFFTNTLSNTRYFQKHSILFTVAFFVPIFFVTYKISELANKWFVFSVFFVEGKPEFVVDNAVYSDYLYQYSHLDLSEIFVYILLGAGLFFATHYLMSKKVNIK